MAANSLKATLPSLQSMKVPREPILITEMKAKSFFRTLCRMITTTCLYVAAFSSITALIYQPPHPWGASNSPDNALLMKFSNDMKKYEVEVTKMGQNNPLFLTMYYWDDSNYTELEYEHERWNGLWNIYVQQTAHSISHRVLTIRSQKSLLITGKGTSYVQNTFIEAY